MVASDPVNASGYVVNEYNSVGTAAGHRRAGGLSYADTPAPSARF
jgi:hypothetical protein